MKKCWDFEPNSRPPFSEITKILFNFSTNLKDQYHDQNIELKENILNSVPILDTPIVKNQNDVENIILKNEEQKEVVIFNSTSYLMKTNNLFKIKFFIFSGKKKGKKKKKIK
jgi:hypothetical protein